MTTDILVICFKYPPEYSGYGNQLKSVLDNMVNKYDHTFTIITMYNSSLKMKDKKRQIVSLNTKRKFSSGKSTYIFSFKLFFWMLKNRKKYKVIHCIKAGPEAVVANLVSKLLKKKLIVKVAQDELSEREIGDSRGLVRLNRKLRHHTLSNVDNFVAISKEIDDDLNKIVSSNTRILQIPNGVDMEKFSPLVKGEKIKIKNKLGLSNNNSTVILFAGAINRRKGIPELLKAIKNLNTKLICTFIFCGPILENISFKEKIEEINNSYNNINVIYKGNVNNVHEFMKVADIFVLPSHSEGLPNVLLEASAAALALIATDIGGSRDIVQEGENGYLVDKDDSQSLSEKLDFLIENHKVCIEMGKKSRARALKKYSIDTISKQYRELYLELIKDV